MAGSETSLKHGKNILDEILKYWQVIIFIVGIIVGWALFESRLSIATENIKELKVKVQKQEEDYQQYQREALQRLSSIEAKVDFLVGNTTQSSKPSNQTTPDFGVSLTYFDDIR